MTAALQTAQAAEPRKSSVIEQAVMAVDAESALWVLRGALRLTPDPSTADMIDRRKFLRGTDAQRFEMIADFVRAECFASIERWSGTSMGPDPIDTVGTRD